MSRMLNPVLGRELKERVRGFRGVVALTVFLVLLTATVWIVYTAGSGGDDFDLSRRSSVGRSLFEWTLAIMSLLVIFLVPGLTAGAVAGERERQTLLPLQVTLLRPRSILWGKIMAAVAFLSLMIVASLPIFAVAYQLGGVSLWDGVRGIACVIVLGLLLATMVLALSAYVKRVQTATLLAYGFAILLTAGPFVAFGIATAIDDASCCDPSSPPAIIAAPSPLVFVADASAGRSGDGSVGPIRFIRNSVDDWVTSNDGWWFGRQSPTGIDDGNFDQQGNVAGPGNFQGGVFLGDSRPSPRAWIVSLAIDVALAAMLFLLATRRLRTPAEAER